MDVNIDLFRAILVVTPKSKIPGSEIFYSCILYPFAAVNIGNWIVPCMDCNMFLGGT